MISRRGAMAAAGALFTAGQAHGQYAQWPDWLGTYTGAARFHRSIPLEDIFPPPKNPSVDLDDRTPFGLQFAIHTVDGNAAVWLRIDAGPMQTAEEGESLRFSTLVDGVALLTAADARPSPRSATLTVRPNQAATEALFVHADGSFWRRHFTATFTTVGADIILWIFDAAGTRARTWRGSTVRRVP